MSTHVTAPREPLRLLCVEYLREPDHSTVTGGVVSWVFLPDLSAEEETRFARLHQLAASDVRITLDECEALLPTLVGLRDYHALASPTGAQTVAAVKGIIRVLRALLRDG